MQAVYIVVPAFNEARNLQILVPKILDAPVAASVNLQVIVIDDGSTDDTKDVLDQLKFIHQSVAAVRLRTNKGKATALQCGFQHALNSGADVIVMMDADGQDDPSELPKLLGQIDSGVDLVTGARWTRNDRFIKRLTSRLFNRMTGLVSGAPGKDFNSGFKAMVAGVALDLTPMLYGEMHRYITVMAHWMGYRTAEVAVAHHERLHGTSKYGVNRFWRGFMDLITVKFLMAYEHRPSHLFGGFGFLSLIAGTGMLMWLLLERIRGLAVGVRPMLLAGVLLVLVGLQLVLFGLLAELLVYVRRRRPYQTGP